MSTPPPLITDLTFTDLDEYRARILTTSGSLVVTETGSFHASLQRTTFASVVAQRGHFALGHVARHPGLERTHFAFLPSSRAPQIWGGQPVQFGQLFSPPRRADLLIRSTAEIDWATISWPTEQLALVSGSLCGRDLSAGPDHRHFTQVPTHAFNRLLALHERAQRLARLGLTGSLSRCASDAFLRALVSCLPDMPTEEDRASVRRHARIMRRMHDVLERQPDEPIELGELCAEIGVSLRTLHACCMEFLNLSPGRYLRLRRLNLARSALRHTEPGADTVTAIALRYGFWELGQFARQYQAAFGEAPSATLGH
jgi:AraC-like DNA-binding protein